MMRKGRGFAIFTAAAAFLLLCGVAGLEAQQRRPALQIGSGYEAVLTAWGSPSEKEEREVRRVDVWRYGKSQVTFREGRVVAWHDADSGRAGTEDNDTAREVLAKSAELETASAKRPIDNTVVEEILAEIMKEPASSDTVEAKPGSPPAPPVMPGQPQPQMIQPSEIIN